MKDGGGGDDSDINAFVTPFIKFKQSVDSQLASGFNAFLGWPDRPEPANNLHRSNDLYADQPSQTSLYSDDMGDAVPRPSFTDVTSVAFTPYSPAALRDLPPPVPNDLPPHMDPSVFTFEDAFEDLLVASQGRPLPALRGRYEQRMLLRQMFPDGEPEWFWLHRLKAQRLTTAPGNCEFERQRPQSAWEEFHQELNSKAPQVWRREAEVDSDWKGIVDFIHQLRESAIDLDEAMTDRFSTPRREEAIAQQDGESPRRREPNTFDELFDSIDSAWADGRKSWDTFMKAIAENHRRTPLDSTQDVREQLQRKVESRDEHVDRFGYQHTTVTTRTLDKDGNEIGRETSYTCRPAQQEPQHHEKQRMQESDSVVQRAPKQSGWFWK